MTDEGTTLKNVACTMCGCVCDDPSWVKGDLKTAWQHHPVNNVTWDEAVLFCEKLTGRRVKKLRRPLNAGDSCTSEI